MLMVLSTVTVLPITASTTGITWVLDSETLTAGTTSVSVKAKHGDFTSEAKIVDGLTVSGSAPAHTHGTGDDAITFDKVWKDATKLPDTAGNYYLDTDVTLNAKWTVPTGTTNLCLNGHVIKQTASSKNVITVGNSTTLNLYDCGETKYKFAVDGTTGLWTLDETNGTQTITGGVITGGSANGGGVVVACLFVSKKEGE